MAGHFEDANDKQWISFAQLTAEGRDAYHGPTRPNSAALQTELGSLRGEPVTTIKTGRPPHAPSFLYRNVKTKGQKATEASAARIREAMSGPNSIMNPRVASSPSPTLPTPEKLAETLSGRVAQIIRRKPLPPVRGNADQHVNTTGISRELQSSTETGIQSMAKRPGSRPSCSSNCISKGTRAAIASRLREIFPKSSFRDSDIVLHTCRKGLSTSQKHAPSGVSLSEEQEWSGADPELANLEMFPSFEAVILGQTAPASVCCGQPLLIELDVRDGMRVSCSSELCTEAVVRIADMQESFRRQVWGKWMKMNAFLLPPRSRSAPPGQPRTIVSSSSKDNAPEAEESGMPTLLEGSQEEASEYLDQPAPHPVTPVLVRISSLAGSHVRQVTLDSAYGDQVTPGRCSPEVPNDDAAFGKSQYQSVSTPEDVRKGSKSKYTTRAPSPSLPDRDVRSPVPDEATQSKSQNVQVGGSNGFAAVLGAWQVVRKIKTQRERVLSKESIGTRSITTNHNGPNEASRTVEDFYEGAETVQRSATPSSVGVAGPVQSTPSSLRQNVDANPVIPQFPKRKLCTQNSIRRPTANEKPTTANGFFLGAQDDEEGVDVPREKKTNTYSTGMRGSMFSAGRSGTAGWATRRTESHAQEGLSVILSEDGTMAERSQEGQETSTRTGSKDDRWCYDSKKVRQSLGMHSDMSPTAFKLVTTAVKKAPIKKHGTTQFSSDYTNGKDEPSRSTFHKQSKTTSF